MTTVWTWRWIRMALRAWLTVVACVAVSPLSSTGQTVPAEPQVTFTKDIAPILQRSCQKCHRPGSVAPMSLLTYEEVRPWARSIKARTGRVGQSDVMPPWYIEKDIGIQRYKGDISLSAAEIASIATWADSGAPRGNPTDLPPPLVFADAAVWEIGEPDLIISSPTVEVGATSPDWWGPLGTSPTGLTEDRYVQAVEMKEVNNREAAASSRETVGAQWAIHHLIWSVVNPDQPTAEDIARLETEDPDEFTRVVSELAGQGFWPIHEVGRNADYFDPRAGLRLRAGSEVTFTSAHLHSTGSHTTTRLDIGLKFHPKGYEPTLTNVPVFTGTLNIDLKGNEANQRVEAFQTLQQNVKLSMFEPHLHAAGVRMCLDAIYATGLMETLSCAGYNHSWVRAYPYADDAAPLLPKGTILRVSGYFDTTPANKNVADGRNWSGLGHRSIDQMMINLSQAVYLTDEQFAEELAERRRALDLTPGQYVLGCPLCGPDDAEVESSSQNQQ